MTTITEKKLTYPYDSLTSALSAETLLYHHDKHYVGYINKLRELIKDTPFEGMETEDIVMSSSGAIFNNAAQVLNHEFYFAQFSPTPKTEPTGRLLEAIVAKYGSVERLKNMLLSSAMSLFGSGWVWLVSDELGNISISAESNALTPIFRGLTPILTIDVWEHAYYIDYRNNRSEAVTKLWNIVDWRVLERRYRW